MTLSDYFLERADIRTLPGFVQDQVLTWTFRKYAYDLQGFPEDFDFSASFLRRKGILQGRLSLVVPYPVTIWQGIAKTLRRHRTGITLDLDTLTEDRGYQQVTFQWEISGRKPRIWTRNQFEFLCRIPQSRVPFRMEVGREGVRFLAVDERFRARIREFPLPETRWVENGPYSKLIRWGDIDALGRSPLRR